MNLSPFHSWLDPFSHRPAGVRGDCQTSGAPFFWPRKASRPVFPSSPFLAVSGSPSYLQSRGLDSFVNCLSVFLCCPLGAGRGIGLTGRQGRSQRGEVTCLKSHSRDVGEPGSTSRKCDCRAGFLQLCTSHIWGQVTLCCRGRPVPCGLRSIPLPTGCWWHPPVVIDKQCPLGAEAPTA